MKKIIAIFFIIFTIHQAKASGPLGKSEITGLMFFSNGLRISGTWTDANNCNNTKNVFLLNSDPNYDKAYSLILTAFASRKKIIGYSDKCVSVDGTSTNMIRGHKYLAIVQ